jgi:dolichol-phosphate mannosyltransferase
MNSDKQKVELAVIMPVYNEKESVETVIREWMPVLREHVKGFVIMAIDDGSKDQSLAVLHKLAAEEPDHVRIITRENRGHGRSCLEGYRWACDSKIPFVFQIDSDGQCNPQYFAKLWSVRMEFDVVYGLRTRRDDGWKRVLASKILLATIFITTGLILRDANVPYRLMKTEKLKDVVEKVPESFFLSNVALAILLMRAHWKHGYVPIRFRIRHGGEPSVPLGKFRHRAVELIKQISSLPK